MMKCQTCGQEMVSICLSCDGHLFGDEIEVRTSGAKVASLLEERQKLKDKYKKLSATVDKLKIGIYLSVSIGLALTAYILLRVKPLTTPPISTIIPPNQHFVAMDFSIEEMLRDVSIRALIECGDCADNSLELLLLNEDNYQRFIFRLGYQPRYERFGIKEFVFDGNLERDRYYIVFYNTSISHPVSINTKIDVYYK
jgi:hypothetical protein